MDLKERQISLRQLMYIYVFIIGSPAIRLFPLYTAQYAKQASWLTIFIAAAVMLVLIRILHKMFEKMQHGSYLDICTTILGKYMGRALAVVYFIWITILCGLYMRYYSDRMTSTLFPNTNDDLFVVILLLVVFFVLRAGIETYARMTYILVYIMVGVFLIITILLVPEIKLDHFFPVTYKDAIPVLHGSMGEMSIFCYITFVLILGDSIHDKSQLKKLGFQSIYILTVLCFITIVAPVGIFGWDVTSRLNLPFFAAVKSITVLGIVERVESGIIAIWIMTDFAIVTALCFTGLRTLKWLFRLPSEMPLINIYLVLIFLISIYFSGAGYEIKAFSFNLLIPINVVLGIAFPFLLFAVGKLRKKL